MSGKPGSTVPVGYGSTVKSGPTVSGDAPPWIALAVGLEVDAPGLVGDQRAVVGVQRRVRVDVQHGRRRAVGGHELRRVEVRLALLQVPVGPHRLVARDARRRAGGRRAGRAGRASPTAAGPTARRRSRPARPRRRPRSSARTVTAPEPSRSKPVTSTPSTISAPAARALSASPSIDSRLNANPPRCSCRQTVSPSRAPVGIQRAHVRRRRPPRR